MARVSDNSSQMLGDDDIRMDAAVAATVASISRMTTWTLVDEMPLRFDVHHPQGMARVGSTWWISTVDVSTRRGLIMAADCHGNLLEEAPIGDSWRYHPGGMDFDGSAFWVACAEYVPDSTTTVFRMQPGEAPHRAFDVDDHVGAIARCGVDGDIVGWSWGSRRFYRWSVDGQLLDARTNPGFFVDHQDCQWLEGGHLLCGGVAEVSLATGPGWLGGLGLLDVDTLEMAREVPFPIYTSTGRVGTHNPLWAEVRDENLILHVLPDDGISTLQSYATPMVGIRSTTPVVLEEGFEPVGASTSSS
ncbi:MAG: DUF6454 family protein [Ilumatobacteraceae bacterium]